MGSSILVVDDDVTFQNLLTFALKNDGHQVTCAGSAREMHAHLKESAFDLVLLDLGLPDEDGIVLLRQLRARAGCVYRKPKPGRSGNEVRQGWRGP
jgi:DNA-binding response OmpR family regulator